MKTKYICGNCGSDTNAETKTPGSILIELVLYLFFIIPGIVYSLWRSSSRKKICHACGGHHLLPRNSPFAQQLLESKRSNVWK